MTPSRHVFKKKSVLLLTVALLNIYAFTSLKPLAHAALPGDNTMPPVFQQKFQRWYTGKNNSFTPCELLTLDTDPSFPLTQTCLNSQQLEIFTTYNFPNSQQERVTRKSKPGSECAIPRLWNTSHSSRLPSGLLPNRQAPKPSIVHELLPVLMQGS